MVSTLQAQIGSSRPWANWAGPNQDFSASADPKLDYSQSPRLLWERELGNGHSAIVADGEYAYCQYSKGKTESLQKLDLASGKIIWQQDYAVTYQSLQYPGPHATPAIADNQIVTASIDGVIRSFELSSGNERWSVDLRQRFRTTLPQSGYAASPLIYDNKVIVATLGDARNVETESYSQPGRQTPPGLVAIDLSNGHTIWKSIGFRSSHATPILIDEANQPMICLHGMFELVSVDPTDGKVLWSHLLRRKASDNVSFTPLWDKTRGQLIISHGYCDRGTQAIGIRCEKGAWKTKLNWSNRDMRVVHTNAVIVDDRIVGTNHNSSGIWIGIECETGKTVFRKRSLGKANFIRVNDLMICQSSEGQLVAGKIGNNEIEESFRLRVSKETSWTTPTITEKHLLCRAGKKLFAYKFESLERVGE